MTTTQLSLEDAMQAALYHRDRGMDAVLGHESEDWRSRADAAIDRLAAGDACFTFDEVRFLAGDPPHHFNSAGAVMSAAAKAGRIECAGYAKSARVQGHSNLVRLWRGAR